MLSKLIIINEYTPAYQIVSLEYIHSNMEALCINKQNQMFVFLFF